MDMIDLMPPGLYEAVITGVDESIENPELVQHPQRHGKHDLRDPVDFQVRDHDRELASFRHGVPGIDGKVYDHLLDLSGVHFHFCRNRTANLFRYWRE